jgi:NitT/TauT family transport system substrate-binding protein
LSINLIEIGDNVRTRPTRYLTLIAALLVVAVFAAACGSSSSKGASTSTAGAGGSGQKATLKLGYLPNVTHAPDVYGIESGSYAKALGPNVTLKTSSFNAGSDAVTALLSGALDGAFLGPGPATNAYTKSGGKFVVVSGVASGGAFLIVKPSITSPADLKGKKIASPQLGNTQDIALRWYLQQQGFKTDQTGGGDVHVLPQDNSTTVTSFQTGDIDGAWVPEPTATKLEQEGGKVLVDERDLWPNKQFVTTVLVMNKDYLANHKDVVTNLIGATSAAIASLKSDPNANQTVADGISKATGKQFKASLVNDSIKSITFTLDPIASSLRTVYDHAVALGLQKKADLSGIFDLALLNQYLQSKNQPAVTS